MIKRINIQLGASIGQNDGIQLPSADTPPRIIAASFNIALGELDVTFDQAVEIIGASPPLLTCNYNSEKYIQAEGGFEVLSVTHVVSTQPMEVDGVAPPESTASYTDHESYYIRSVATRLRVPTTLLFPMNVE